MKDYFHDCFSFGYKEHYHFDSDISSHLFAVKRATAHLVH